MWLGTVNVDGNGIIIFDPETLRAWRPKIEEGSDLFSELTTTSVGEEALARGLFVPILAIDDGGYDIVVRDADERLAALGDTIVTNGQFALHVTSGLVLADLAVLRHWMQGVGWIPIATHPGYYAVTIYGFRRMSVDGSLMEAAGYEVVLSRVAALPRPTGDVGKGMRVMNWWGG